MTFKAILTLWAAASTLYAGHLWKHTQTVTSALIQSQDNLVCVEEVQQQVILRTDSVLAQTVALSQVTPPVKVIYRTVIIPDPAYQVDALFSDTSYYSTLEQIDSVQAGSAILVPKSFVYQDSSIYLAGTVHRTGITIDSLSVPVQVSFDHQISDLNSRWKSIAVTPLFDNPFVTGGAVFKLEVRKPLIGRFNYRVAQDD